MWSWARAKVCANPDCPDHQAHVPFARKQPSRFLAAQLAEGTSDIKVIARIVRELGGLRAFKEWLVQVERIQKILDLLGGLEGARETIRRLEELKDVI
jgi:hypothetical protein